MWRAEGLLHISEAQLGSSITALVLTFKSSSNSDFERWVVNVQVIRISMLIGQVNLRARAWLIAKA